MSQLSKITSAYNFVPLNKEVYNPSWAKEISHDIPFKDGVSGEVDIKIIAKTPIFIKNNENNEKFCNYNGDFFIPGSSVKGMIRNILEIISFSKLKLEDKILSFRDLNNQSYKNKAMVSNKIYMGWLYKNKKEIKIDSVGKITESETRIKYKDMKKYLDSSLVDKIARTNEAYKKYNLVKDLDKLKTSIGTIVFTGKGVLKKGKNKTKEFLFPNKVIKEYVISDKLFQIFKEAYYLDSPNESADWKNSWSKKFENSEKIPVFFQLDESDNIEHFGLSMLYKLPYENSLQDLLEAYQNFDENEIDLAEAIFGYTNKNEDSLKSRVQFSHFKALSVKEFEKSIFLPLSSPRPTFYPNYLVQCEKNGKVNEYITYDNTNAILRGFKLYPPRKKLIFSQEICKNNPKVCSKFIPLKENAQFTGKLRFHNLKKEELGALICAVTFLGNEDKYYHKIGKAKAYGFGTVSLKIEKLKIDGIEDEINLYKNLFIKEINSSLNINLLKHPRIESLFKLSSYYYDDEDLKILDLKDFAFAKKHFNKFTLKEVVENSYEKEELCKQINQPNKNKSNYKSKNYKPNSQNKKYNKSKSIAKNLSDFFGNS